MKRFATVWLALMVAGTVHAEDVHVAVAANFSAPMNNIGERFERDTGHKVLVTVGATGKFYAQIKNGAPFEVLLSADDETPARLEKEGSAVADTRFTYAIGKLVLWSAQSGVVDPQGQVLAQGGFAHLAIANPKLAPYGAAALQTLDKLGVRERLAARLVQGDSIAQTHQFIVSGAATLGFVAMSQVFSGGKLQSGSAWVVPAGMYSPLRQDAVLLERGRGKPAALAFLRYLKSEPAREVIRSYGYDL
ncbi:molybdate ABC transporter substrate-binding protein [Massilia antarctica]|uniref:molybdate ABC transporter substrate-binding protein n=1 Tax=Massilia antarctica TaxID=2765360 RepID=UPI0006BB7099|nr:molybdate ABC transporter substrate-binding protein [Massilia sp. H27-R4]MCY0912594.1 molybdate ABC transporter substrate-binding protein [Massilia sp. H27-R4]CUI03651.1 Molybdenum ABC transporter, periplasmic molybdenum-binding protein ModA (TC 3.A.1.8.1) [Janthinobacterium sp. CG23_2]CUU27437.1 Molybdenum ABC transporter, periplasmic molybdenum-binding protein ModA (TC 3.A.1.8.1) [Janthinobacterium sp. CG23_2]